MRATINRVGVVLGAPVAAIVFTAVRKGNDFAVTANFSTGGGAPVTCDVADVTGKVRLFRDVDDCIKAAANAGLIHSGTAVGMSVSNLVALEPALFTGDIIAKLTRQLTSVNAEKVKAQATSAELATVIAAMAANSPAEIAYKAEKQLQKATVDAHVVWLTSEQVRIAALLV